MPLISLYLLLSSMVGVVLADDPPQTSVKDPLYGQVLFDFYQQNYFSAITHLTAAQRQGRLLNNDVDARLLLAGLYFSYGMPRSAETTINQLLQRPVSPQERNRIWLALAGIHYKSGDVVESARLLRRIDAPLPSPQESERQLLESRLLAHRGRYAEAAAQLLNHQPGSLESDFAQYNLALDHIRRGRDGEGRALLVALLQRAGSNESESAELYDKSRIALGYSHLRRQEFIPARGWFEQVRLNSPFATQALLGLGWVEYGLGQGDQALSIWLPLIERNPSDPAVLEGLLAVPYTFSQLGAQQQALDHYKKAIEAYNSELATLEGIISGMNFSALAQELVDPRSAAEAGWQWRAEIGPRATLSPYLYKLMAGDQFQEALRNYRDLLYLGISLAQWLDDLDAYEAMVDVRQAGYESRLPLILDRLARLDGKKLQQQRDHYLQRLREIDVANDARSLATGEEEQHLARLAEIESGLNRLEVDVNVDAQRRKYTVLKGMMVWQQESNYPARLWQTKQGLRQLDETLAESVKQQQSLNSVLESSSNRFDHYRKTVQERRRQTVELQQQVNRLTAQSEMRLQQLTQRAVADVKARVEDYRSQAFFAVAQIYDTAQQAEKDKPW